MSSILNTSRIAIIGLGQLGASLAMRIKEIKCIELFAVTRREEVIREAIDQGIIDAGTTNAADILPVVDVCFLCLPLDASIAFVKDNLEHFRKGSIVTDVGSVKGSICLELRQLLFDHGVYFMGGHPMAGTEKSGLANANAQLYEDAICFLTPFPEDEPDMINIVKQIWQDIGSNVIEMPHERHDMAVANCSHQLHILSSALSTLVLSKGDAEANKLAAAGGFRDMSRIAASEPGMWTEISKHNKTAILKTMDQMQTEIDNFREAIETNNWDKVYQLFEEAAILRNEWYENEAKARGYK